MVFFLCDLSAWIAVMIKRMCLCLSNGEFVEYDAGMKDIMNNDEGVDEFI